MIECIDQLQVLISERLDHLQMLLLDQSQLNFIVKDDQKKRAVVKNFRIIKAAQKIRSNFQTKELQTLTKINRKLTKQQINICENMFVNCMNQYLNTQYESKSIGEVNDILDAFIYYFTAINAESKINQLKVIKNCGLFYQTNFLVENLTFFITNIQESLNHVYQKQKTHFFNLLKTQTRTTSPEKRAVEEQDVDKLERFDKTGNYFGKKKKNLQIYCFQLSKLLNLEQVMIDYFYFSAMEFERRKKILESNFMKRNIHILRQVQSYDKQYQNYRVRKINYDQMASKHKRKESTLSMESLM